MRPPLVTPARTAAVSAAVFSVLLTLVVLRWEPLLSLDRTLAGELHRAALADPALTRANRILSDWVWDPVTMRAAVAAGCLVLWLRGRRLLAGWLAATLLATWGVQQAVKYAVDRDRPAWRHPVDSADLAAFPSGHAMTATVACVMLLWVLRRQGVKGAVWGAAVAVAAVSAIGVGMTRMWLGVHWPGDVVGGWLLGICGAAVSIAAYGRLALSGDR